MISWRIAASPGCKLTGEHSQHRIVAQVVMIVEILIAERNRNDPLAEQRRDGRLHTAAAAAVTKAGRKAFKQRDRLVRRAEKQRTAIRCDPTAIEGATIPCRSTRSKANDSGLACVSIGNRLRNGTRRFRKTAFPASRTRCAQAQAVETRQSRPGSRDQAAETRQPRPGTIGGSLMSANADVPCRPARHLTAHTSGPLSGQLASAMSPTNAESL